MKKYILFLLIFASIFITLGEIDFRWLQHEQRLAYDVDDALLWRLKPNQAGFEWLANMSQKSPEISINNLGFRGTNKNLNTLRGKRVLAVGSSSVLGAGVTDKEVWSAVLEQKLHEKGEKITLFNGANPGWGPFQHANFITTQSNLISPDLMIVFASRSDMNFLPIEDPNQKKAYLERSRTRKKLLEISPFFTHLIRKIEILRTRQISTLHSNFNYLISHFSNKKKESNKNKNINKKLDKHEPYWKQIVDFSDKNNIPLIFYIPDIEDSQINQCIAEKILMLTTEKDNITVRHLTGHALSSNTNLQSFLIQNDGHPNALYHYLIANDLFDTFEELKQKS